MPEFMTLASNLKVIRKEMGETQEIFAWHCDMSVEELSLLERRRSDPKLSTLQKVASYTNLTVSELLDRTTPITKKLKERNVIK